MMGLVFGYATADETRKRYGAYPDTEACMTFDIKLTGGPYPGIRTVSAHECSDGRIVVDHELYEHWEFTGCFAYVGPDKTGGGCVKGAKR